MIKRIAIGIDRGFGATKYCSGVDNGLVDSLVAPITEKRAKDIISNNKVDGSVFVLKREDLEKTIIDYYLVGKYVSLAEPDYAERDLQRNRKGINEIILFLLGMGLSTGEIEETEVVVTTGLPTDDYDKLAKEYAEFIMNDKKPYVFSIFNKGVEIKKKITVIDANIENQPKGTIISCINEKLRRKENWMELKNQRYGVCDIGFNTTDLSMYVGKDIIKGAKNNFSTFGMVEILSTIKKMIEDEFNCKKTEDDVLAALTTNKIKVKGKFNDCTEIIKKGFEEKAKQLVVEISSKWEDYLDNLDEIILTGGSIENPVFRAALIKNFKEITGWEVTIINNPQQANANGFYLVSASILHTL